MVPVSKMTQDRRAFSVAREQVDLRAICILSSSLFLEKFSTAKKLPKGVKKYNCQKN